MSIRDLARHLNLSIGTVSRALNGRSDVNVETRRRVLEAARRLGYSPNQSGRNLRKGTTHAVAFMLQPHPGAIEYGEPFFIQFLAGAQSALAARGLDLIVVMGEPGSYQYERLRRVVESRLADAVLLSWTRRRDERIEYLTEVGFPFATLGRSHSGGGHFPSLDMDFELAAMTAVDRLAAAGHRRIATMGPSADLNFGYLFVDGFRRGLARNGLAEDPALILAGELNEADGHALTHRLLGLAEPPTAIVYDNDYMALGGYRALAERGLRPGADVACVVAVDSPVCRHAAPPLTTFNPQLEALGARLAEILLAAMPAFAGPQGPQVIEEVWPMHLVPRASDGPVRRPALAPAG